MSKGEWKFFRPGEGEKAEDATIIHGSVWDAEDAARMAVEYDYSNCDGWERGDREFEIVVISPAGEHTAFMGSNEPDIIHTVRPRP